ncbi:hypothetical protein [Pleurocapsa sp. PCC 7319]|uniref:hypothetical protein n=1 Tax=Pleurocapsa sp. PCC 7319 TaxID=118161 RepID=UPI00034DDB4B|nr:hypothetical protein [Pleurocapsa sp. PCC 7319]
MGFKELIQTELEFLSEDELQELYELVKSRSQKYKNNHDDLGELLERCKIHTGISDLSAQHDHYLYGTDKKEVE